ncbi:MAG: endonuclease/exonuclease/phosphatase family protein [Akkermansiaceae bacterium]|nr:endonuclease/exonuclease/phosphatase family protein [Akkermansiaceae bacterium]
MLRLFFALVYICLIQPDLRADDIDVKILTYNIRYDARGDMGVRDWQQRKSAVTDYLANSKASIIGLQEVVHNQLLDVDKALPGHAYVGVGRDDGKTRGEYSPIFYDTKLWKLDPSEQGTFWLSDTPEVVSSRTWGNGIPRICTWARLIGKNGKAVYVYNTHWDHRSQNSRVHAAGLILKKIRARTHASEPFILMGDFNSNTENPAIQTLLRSGILTDPGKKQFLTFSSWKAGLVPGLRIDHIFTSTLIKKAKVEVQSNDDDGGHAASDHHPVVLTMRSPFKPPR